MNIKNANIYFERRKKMSLCFYSHRIVPNISYTIPSFDRFHAYIIIHRPENEREKKKILLLCMGIFGCIKPHIFPQIFCKLNYTLNDCLAENINYQIGHGHA